MKEKLKYFIMKSSYDLDRCVRDKMEITAGGLVFRSEGETGVVPIDRYPGVRERIVNQLLGAQCMDTLREKIADPTYAVRNAEMIEKIRPGE